MSATKKPLTFDMDRAPTVASPLPAASSKSVLKQQADEDRKQVGARITGTIYRQLKARAAMQGDKVQDLVEQAITEFLNNHPA